MATVTELRSESLRIKRELTSPHLSSEQRAAKRDRQDKVNHALTVAIGKEEEKNRAEMQRDQARRDSWLERGESRRLRR